MDHQTLAAYDQEAAAFAKDWLGQPSPVDLQEVVERFFVRGGNSADIGCGCGREVAWLHANGFSAVGFDASEGLLNEARRRYPSFKFTHAELPELRGVGTFDNVLCETVIMHLDRKQIAPSARRLFDIVKPSGILYLSWRVTEGADQRDAQGRLYAAFDPAVVLAELKDASVLLDEEVVSASSGTARPHPEERVSRVSKDEWHQRSFMVRDGAARLLTMRVYGLPRQSSA